MPDIEITLKDGSKKIVEFEDGYTEEDIDEVAEELNSKLIPVNNTIEGKVEKFNPIYADILENDSLTKEQKAEAIKQRGEEELKKLDREKALKLAKIWGGGALSIGASALPFGGAMALGGRLGTQLLRPVVGRAIGKAIGQGALTGLGSGAIEGLAQTMIQDGNGADWLINPAKYGLGGLLGGSLIGGVGGKITKTTKGNKLKKHKPVAEMTPEERKQYSHLGKDYYLDYLAGTSVNKDNYGKIYFNSNQAGKDSIHNLEVYPTIKKQLKTSKVGKPTNDKPRTDGTEYFDHLYNTHNGRNMDYEIAVNKDGKKYYTVKDITNESISQSGPAPGQVQTHNSIINDSSSNINPTPVNVSKKDEAWAILSEATGKDKKWLKMRFNKNNEAIEEALEQAEERLSSGDLINNLQHYNGKDLRKIAEQAFEDIRTNNFDDVDDIIERHFDGLVETDQKQAKEYKKMLDDFFKTKDFDTAQAKFEELYPNADDETVLKFFNDIGKLENGNATSKFVNTVQDSRLANYLLKRDLQNVGYDVIHNEDLINNAQNIIEKDNNLFATAHRILKEDKLNAQDVAVGLDLVRRLQNTGEKESIELAGDLIQDLSIKSTKAGQSIQALKIWNLLTPEGALLKYQKEIDKNIPTHVKSVIDNARDIANKLNNATSEKEINKILNNATAKFSGSTKTRIKSELRTLREQGNLDQNSLISSIKKEYKIPEITEETRQKFNQLVENVKNAQTDREKDVATALLKREIEEVKPASLGRKLSTIQTGAQLLNPKTILRNVAGNTLFGGTELATQGLAGLIDRGLSKVTGQRTIGNVSPKRLAEGLKNGFNLAKEDIAKGIDTSANAGKYDLFSGRTFRDNDPAILQGIEKALNYSLRLPDRMAYQSAYNDVLGGLLELKNAGLNNFTKAEMEEIANKEALYRTFQDDNKLSLFAQNMKRGLNLGNDFGAGDFILKYAKTPSNILLRGVDYSPIGLAKGVGEGLLPLLNKNMEFNQRAVAQDLARGLIGSGLVGSGTLLAHNGLISGENDNKSRLRANENARGDKPYAVRIGDKNLSYDWAVPISLPLSSGANFSNKSDLAEALLSSMNTLTEQPLLQGLKKVAGNGFESLPEAGLDLLAESPMSFYPSALRQLNQTIDPYYRETRSSNKYGSVWNRAKANIPYISQQMPIKYDVTGQPVTRGVYDKNADNSTKALRMLGRGAQAFLNPANVSRVNDDRALNEVLNLYDKTENGGVLFPYVGKSVNVDGEKIPLNNEQISQYQKVLGSMSSDYINRLMNSNNYQYMTDEQKADNINNIYKKTNEVVKSELFNGHNPLSKKQKTADDIINNKLRKLNVLQNKLMQLEMMNNIDDYE